MRSLLEHRAVRQQPPKKKSCRSQLWREREQRAKFLLSPAPWPNSVGVRAGHQPFGSTCDRRARLQVHPPLLSEVGEMAERTEEAGPQFHRPSLQGTTPAAFASGRPMAGAHGPFRQEIRRWQSLAPQPCLNLRSLPQGQGTLRPTFVGAVAADPPLRSASTHPTSSPLPTVRSSSNAFAFAVIERLLFHGPTRRLLFLI